MQIKHQTNYGIAGLVFVLHKCSAQEGYGIRAVALVAYDELDGYKDLIGDELQCVFDISLPGESYLTPKIEFETGIITPKLDDSVFLKAKAILKI